MSSSSNVVSHSTAIQRIIDVLRSDTEIFEKNKKDRLRRIKFGSPPQNNVSFGNMLPCAYVTTLQSLQKIHPQFGHSDNGADLPDKTDYAVIMAVPAVTTEKAQRDLYDLEAKVRTALERDRTFAKADGTDPLFTRSTIVDSYRDSSLFGKNIETVTLVLQTESGNVNSISIGDDITNIPILSSNVRNTETNAPIIDTSRSLRGYAPVAQSHTRQYEIEWTATMEEKLTKLKNARDTIRITDNGTEYMGVIGAINIMVRFDQLKTMTVQFDVL